MDEIISRRNELTLHRRSTFTDVIEQIQPFFDFQLVVVDNAYLDRLDLTMVDRKKLTFLCKNNHQWSFTENSDNSNLYTVFTQEAADWMMSPILSEISKVQADSESESDKDLDLESSDVNSENVSDIFTDGWTSPEENRDSIG
jgi:hypothetical protein